MKILFVNYEWPPLGGGGGVAMAQLVEALDPLHDLAVLTSRTRDARPLESAGQAPVYRARVLGRHSRSVASMASMCSFVPAGVWRGWRVLRREHFDLINTWFAIPSGPTGVLLSRLFKIPHCLTLIGGDVYDPSKWYSPHRNAALRAVVRWAMEHSRFCTAISNDVRERAQAIFPREKTIDVIPLGIRPPVFTPADRGAIGMDPDAFYCVTVGRLIRRKRLPLLVERFARSTDPKLKLLIIGEGPEEAELRASIQAGGLAGRVVLAGAVSEERKFQYLANSDAYVSVSEHEGFGLVFLEAMACGLPVVAPAIGGQRDFLRHGETGLVLDSDADDLMRRVTDLYETPEKVIEMRAFNRRYVERYFIDNVADLWAETFEKYIKSLY